MAIGACHVKTVILILKKENLEFFLKNLTNKEFAFFFRYRRTEFMPESQNKIQLELKNRSLSESLIMKFTNEVGQVQSGNRPHCDSNRFLEIKETELRATKYGGYEVEVNSRKCQICSYNAQKDKPINWKVRLNRFLGKYAWPDLETVLKCVIGIVIGHF